MSTQQEPEKQFAERILKPSKVLNDSERCIAENLVATLLNILGHDIQREGLQRTPARYVRFLEEFCNPEPFEFTTFKPESTGMIVQSNIPFNSLCEHHLAPFSGIATVGYLPDDTKMLGLSKLARSVRHVASGLQNQERITRDIADLLVAKTGAKGVGVILKAQHYCMCMRGVGVSDVWTTTTELRGLIADNPQSRSEFLMHHHR